MTSRQTSNRRELAPDAPIACRLCGATAAPVCVQRVLRRYEARYFHCSSCDLIQTQDPIWLEEAYTAEGPSLDTGAIQRTTMNVELVRAVAAILTVCPWEPCVDYGAGPGILVRAMRDLGYDFRWHDLYAQNFFASGFEANVDHCHRLLTAFEVWEHLDNPVAGLDAMFSPRHDLLLISTFLHQGGHRENWWYYVPETGQHVAFYSRRTMEFIAHRFGYRAIVSQRYTLFVRSDLSLASWRINVVRRLLNGARPNSNSRWVQPVLALSPRYRSRTWDDHVHLRDRPAAA